MVNETDFAKSNKKINTEEKTTIKRTLTLYVNELLWHLELPRVYGLIVSDVTFCLRNWNNHIIPLLAVHLLCRDSPLKMVFLKTGKTQSVSSETDPSEWIATEGTLGDLTAQLV